MLNVFGNIKIRVERWSMADLNKELKKHASRIVDILLREYPDAEISLKYSDSFELLVAVILSAQCTDNRVNMVTEMLFKKYRTIEDYANSNSKEFSKDIASITYFNQKAKWIVDTARYIIEMHRGEVPSTMEELLELPGVGRKTANVVLQHAYGETEGIAVDTHVMRLSRRMGLVEKRNRDAIEAELMKIIPRKKWRRYTHLMIAHGRAVCKARNPKCDSCPVGEICPSSWVYAEVDLSNGKLWKKNGKK
jgi:endonuclease-3